MLAPLHPVQDIKLSGQIIHTGKSSMEIAVKMEAMTGKQETMMLGQMSWTIVLSSETDFD